MDRSFERFNNILAERKNRLEREKGGKGVDKLKKVEKKDEKKKELSPKI